MSALMLHRVKSITHQVDHWFVGGPNAYSTHRIELRFEDGSSFTISLFASDSTLKLEQLPERSLPAQEVSEPDSDPTPWCNACGARTKARCECGDISDNE